MAVEGIPQRDVVVTFERAFASYNAGESAAFTADEAQRLADLGVAASPDSPPRNMATPYVSQAADVLSCTMGEWNGSPTGYAYAWAIDGAPAGTDAASYTVVAADTGKTATCVVTATNANGSTAAPPSNGVVVAEAAP